MPLPEKPFFALDELAQRWKVPVKDLGSYAVDGQLTLAIIGKGQTVTTASAPAKGRRPCKKTLAGVVAVDGLEAWQAFEGGTATLSKLRPARGRGCFTIAHESDRLRISMTDLYISREERRRFEIVNGLTAPDTAPADDDPPPRRGRKSDHDWDAFWNEVYHYVYREGRPKTQEELVVHMVKWFSIHSEFPPDASTIRKKIKRFWKGLVLH